MTDGELRSHVSAELAWDPKIDSSEVAVSVQDGVVTLRGQCRHRTPDPGRRPDDHHDLQTQPRAEASRRVQHGHTFPQQPLASDET